MSKRLMIYMVLILAAVASVGLFGYRYYQDNRTEPAATSPETTPISYPVKVYFSKHPESDNDPGQVFAVARTSPDLGVGKFAITELLKGPTETEKAAGYFTTARLRDGASNCNGQNFSLSIDQAVATLRFCRVFDHLGVVADGQADSELKATLTQFPSVQKVIILNRDNNCEFDLSGLNLCKQ